MTIECNMLARCPAERHRPIELATCDQCLAKYNIKENNAQLCLVQFVGKTPFAP